MTRSTILQPPTDMTSRPAFADSHPSIAASMDDFEAREFSPTVPVELPSQHSGFRSNAGSEYSEASSRRSYSPPAWRKAGSSWFHQPSLSPHRRGDHSIEPSPQRDPIEEGDGHGTEYRAASRIPLPDSPLKGRSPSHSPQPSPGRDAAEGDGGGGAPRATPPLDVQPEVDTDVTTSEPSTPNNYFRFSTRLDVVQKTQTIEEIVVGVRKMVRNLTRSKWNTLVYVLSSLAVYWLAVTLLSTPTQPPVPDLIKVAGLAKSFEPVIYYSERGHSQITELQDTGVAVWDLGESVRSTNMTSAPIIVEQLDQLSESIKTLAIELTRFFSGVDGDIDHILLTMEWAQRELTSISSHPPTTIGSVWSNTHTLLARIGLASPSQFAQRLLGMTHQQLTSATLERVFHEYLGVLEESINNELGYSVQLFGLFAAIDQQFLNLQRTVIREQDTQERAEGDVLSSLWTRVIGANASTLRKYERNRALLASVRARTVQNKHVLAEHHQRLLQLKANLETLRRRLVGPLVRSQNSSTLSVAAQLDGLEATYRQLKSSREGQRRKMMELVWGGGGRPHEVPALPRLVGEPAGEGRVAEYP